MSRKILNPLILLEASTGIEPVYTDLQSAASPLRQLASMVPDFSIAAGFAAQGRKRVDRCCRRPHSVANGI